MGPLVQAPRIAGGKASYAAGSIGPARPWGPPVPWPEAAMIIAPAQRASCKAA